MKFKKNLRKLVIISIVIFAIIFIYNGNMHNSSRLQQEIADNIIRFHVIANSDSESDQDLKYDVRDYISGYMKEILSKDNDIDSARKDVVKNLDMIEQKANEYVKRCGYNYKVTAVLENTYFPVKSYGDYTFPSGQYEALRLIIGDGIGKNWWCVLYPNLCFADETYAVVSESEKEKLEKQIPEDAYDLLTASSDKKLKIRFAIWEKAKYYLNNFM